MYVQPSDVRCPNCGKLLFKTVVSFGTEIKCPRCKQIVPVNTQAEIPSNNVLTDVLDDVPTLTYIGSENLNEVLKE